MVNHRAFAVFIIALFYVSAIANPLVPFKSCFHLRSYMVDNGVKRVRSWGFWDPYSAIRHRKAVSGDPKKLVEGKDFSGTNVQVSGVDEPDIVKTDGKRVFVLSRKQFYYVTVTKGGESGKVIANLTLPTNPIDMLFYKDSVMVISEEYQNIERPSPPPVSSSSSSSFFFPFPWNRQRRVTIMYRLDVSKEDVKITDTTRIYGRYVSARSVNGIARVVISYNPTNYLPLVHHTANITKEQALVLNKKIILHSKLSDWVPMMQTKGTRCFKPGWCTKYRVRRFLTPCSSTYYPKNEFSGFSFLSVATIQMTGRFIPTGVSVVADGRTVYSTAKSMYVATTKYRWDKDDSNESSPGRPNFTTSFHKFALAKGNAEYKASGTVTGSVLNQFSMHEYGDSFFVATTEGSPWWTARDSSVSKVSAFRVSKNTLAKVGEVSGLGKGEKIYAVRYIGDVAYVVTFRRVDPLYIVDLSDVTKLQVLGELKIPGYSAYLHPIGEGRLLGVGREATPDGRTTGAKVSLFDVSNVSKPKELSSWTLKGSYSNAEWDHRAFLYWQPEKLAVLPVSVYSRNKTEQFYGSIALEVSDSEVKERGRYMHSCCGSQWQIRIQRNFVIGGVHLWSLSQNALQINDIKSLKNLDSVKL